MKGLVWVCTLDYAFWASDTGKPSAASAGWGFTKQERGRFELSSSLAAPNIT